MSKIITIDCDYVMPGVACAYLIIDNGKACFVENNTSLAVPKLLRTLEGEGLSPEDVDYAIITHCHLDHAGGSGALIAACPHATLLAHPKSAKHMIDPSRLIASSQAVYGDEFPKLYGEILSVPKERVRIMEDGEKLPWQSREFSFFYTKGHANHHFCIFDTGSSGVFTGDTFGIAYPRFSEGGSFLFPTTTPTDFDPEEAILSVDKILQTGAERAYLTHFDSVENLEELAVDLKLGIQRLASVAREGLESALDGEELQEFCEKGVRSYLRELALSKGKDFTEKDWSFLEFDTKLNAQGLVVWVHRQRKKQNNI